MSESERGGKDKTAEEISVAASAQTVGSKPLPPTDTRSVTGGYNRNNYIDTKKMKNFKEKAYRGKKAMVDASGNLMHKSKNAAMNKYGKNNYTKHTTQTDHIYSAREAHQYAVDHKLNVSHADIKATINKDNNFQEISQHNNQSKGARSTSEFIKDNKDLTNQQKIEMKFNEIKAKTEVRSELQIKSTVNNIKDAAPVALDGFKGGAQAGATSGAVVSVSRNIAEVAKGDKDLGDAVIDVLADTATSAVVGGGMGAGTEVAKFGLDKLATGLPANQLAKPIGNALKFVGENVGNIAVAAVQAYSAISSYAKGEIDEADLLMGIGDIGVGIGAYMVGSTVGAIAGGIVGSAVPIIGNAAGAFLGKIIGGALACMFASEMYKKLGTALLGSQSKVVSRRLKAMYDEIGAKVKKSREELEDYLNYLHNEMHVNIIEGFKEMKLEILSNDAEGAVDALKEICAQFGVKLQFEDKSEFDKFMVSDKAFVLE